jgi:DNA helicase IV
LRHLGKPAAHVEVLRRGYRVPANVIDFASRLLPHIAPGVAPAESVRENLGVLDILPTSDLGAAVDDEVRRLLAVPGSVGIIVADGQLEQLHESLAVDHAVLGRDESGPRVTLLPASLAKGLEFDHVVVVEPSAIVAAEPSQWQGLRRLYVVLTRAVSGLSVVHTGALPAELTGVAA